MVEKLRWYWAIQDKIAIEELDFFDGLPPFYWSRARSWFCRRSLVMIGVIWLALRVWTIRVSRLENRSMVVVVKVLLLLGRIMRERVPLRWRWLIWLCKIGVVMVFRGYGIVVSGVAVTLR